VVRVALLAACLGLGCASVAPCGVAEHEILGAWRHVSGPSFFEEIAFSRDEDGRWFNSWLHERPETVNVPWSYEACTLRIAPVGEPSAWEFPDVRVRGSTLLLRESADGEPWIFERIPEAEGTGRN
jgi:hypothetical protein